MEKTNKSTHKSMQFSFIFFALLLQVCSSTIQRAREPEPAALNQQRAKRVKLVCSAVYIF